jgi:opacity protein-like surface antigen
MGEDDDDVLGVDVETSTEEFAGGLRYTFGQDRFRPYVGVGVSWIELELKASDAGNTVKEDDDSFGLYVAGGFDAWVTQRIALGLEYRILMGTDMTLFDVDTDADYGQLAVTASLGF